jgi:hypothetical protein
VGWLADIGVGCSSPALFIIQQRNFSRIVLTAIWHGWERSDGNPTGPNQPAYGLFDHVIHRLSTPPTWCCDRQRVVAALNHEFTPVFSAGAKTKMSD